MNAKLDNAAQNLANEVEEFLKFNASYPYTKLALALNDFRKAQLDYSAEFSSDVEQMYTQFIEAEAAREGKLVKLILKKDLK